MTKREWQEWKEENYGDVGALIDLANDEGIGHVFDDIISADDVDYFVERRMENGGWQGVACCLYDIVNNLNDDYYEIDGYENLTTIDDWDSLADDLENNLDLEDSDLDD